MFGKSQTLLLSGMTLGYSGSEHMIKFLFYMFMFKHWGRECLKLLFIYVSIFVHSLIEAPLIFKVDSVNPA